MARYDKYEPYGGGFRALLAVDYIQGDLGTVIGIGINANGALVKGAGTSGIVGVLVSHEKIPPKAGEVVDPMTHGEIVEFGGVAGRQYYSSQAGVISNTPATGSVKVGHTVEAGRLIVRVTPGAQA